MATAEGAPAGVAELQVEKGLKTGALGLVSATVMGVASTAPAYSLAATLGFIVAVVGLGAPIVAVIAFVPIFLTSIGYSELNKADPDCGTTFTWAARAFGPKTGWAGGWAIVAADVLVMASLAQVAGQYVFLLFGAKGIGSNATSGWVLLVGLMWIAAMTYICYRGIEVSAWFQRVLLGVELVMLLVFSITALVRVGTGNHPAGSITPAWSWFNPMQGGFSGFVTGIILMLFIYWGWDTAVAINEETKDPAKTPGRAAILSTLILLVTYVIVILSAQSFAGVGTTGIGLGNSANTGDVISVLGSAVFGGSGIGLFLSRLLVLMVLSSAAASTQTTILPTARTTLSMATYKALPKSFAKMHPRYLTPTVSTIVMGVVSALLYLAFNYISQRLRHRRRGDRDRPVHRLLLRPDRVRLRLVLPQDAAQQPAEPVDAGHPADARRADHVRGGRLVHLGRLGRGDRQQLHVLADAVLAALVPRRRVRHRLPLGTRRPHRRDLDQVRHAGVLPQADPHQGHPHPRPRRIGAGDRYEEPRTPSLRVRGSSFAYVRKLQVVQDGP